MDSSGTQLRALLVTGRAANLPTVWSNVIASFFLAGGTQLLPLGLALIFSSLIYLGACFLGDLRDIEHDRIHRPERPLPQGVLSKKGVRNIAVSLLIIAAAILLFIPTLTPAHHPLFTGGLLMIASLTYARFHQKKSLLSLLNMASCRSLLVLFSASLASLSAYSILFALCMGIYTFLLSCVAASENSPNAFSRQNLLSAVMLILPIAAIYKQPIVNPFLVLPYFIHTTLSKKLLSSSKPAFVSRALAGFCLLDACFASTHSPTLSLTCISLFLTALLFQRITPAT